MWAMPALGFGVAVAFWPGLLSAATAPRWCLIAAGLPLAARIDPRGLSPLVIVGLTAFLAYATLSLAWTPDPLTGLNDLFRLVICVAVFIAAVAIEDIAPILVALCLGVAFSGVLCLVQFAGYSPVDQLLPPAGLFYNRLFLAEAAAPLAVWAICSQRWRLVPMLLIPLVLCESREAIAACCIGFCLFSAHRRAWLIGAAVFATELAVIGFIDPTKFASAAERITIWQTTLDGVRPFGNGLGAFMANFPHWEYAHSDFLQLIYETGIGAVVAVAFAIAVVWRAPNTPERSALAVLGVEAVVSFPLHMPATAFMAMVLAGYLARGRAHVRLLRSYGGGQLGAAA